MTLCLALCFHDLCVAGVLGTSSYIEVFNKTNCKLLHVEQLVPQPSGSRAWDKEDVKAHFLRLFQEAAAVNGSENKDYLPAFKRILHVVAAQLDGRHDDQPDEQWKRLSLGSHIVIDTHTSPGYLDRLAPDISVCSLHTSEAAVHAFNVVSLVELQVCMICDFGHFRSETVCVKLRCLRC